MTELVEKRAYAKINLFLRVTGKRDGYHEIETLMQSIDLSDRLLLSKAEDGSITSDFEGDNSLVVLRALAQKFSLGGMRLSIEKHIPIGAGLGGSSADAAAAALACAELWGLDVESVKKTVSPLFGDVAFQMTGGTAIARGFGDEIGTLPSLPVYPLLLVFPQKGVSTAEAYAISDSLAKGSGNALSLYWALTRGESADRYYLNDLLPAATILNDEIEPLLRELKEDRALLTGMTGSGSTLFAVYRTRAEAEARAAKLSAPTLVTRTITPYHTK